MCGSNTGLAGFGNPNDAGVWEGIDVDVCRAVAAAVFGDSTGRICTNYIKSTFHCSSIR